MAFGIRTEQEDLTAATNVGNSSRVRVHNSDTSAILMTLKDSEGTTLGSMTIGAGESVEVWKNPTETLEGGAALLVTGVTSN